MLHHQGLETPFNRESMYKLKTLNESSLTVRLAWSDIESKVAKARPWVKNQSLGSARVIRSWASERRCPQFCGIRVQRADQKHVIKSLFLLKPPYLRSTLIRKRYISEHHALPVLRCRSHVQSEQQPRIALIRRLTSELYTDNRRLRLYWLRLR